VCFVIVSTAANQQQQQQQQQQKRRRVEMLQFFGWLSFVQRVPIYGIASTDATQRLFIDSRKNGTPKFILNFAILRFI